jgi:hypothetical protein
MNGDKKSAKNAGICIRVLRRIPPRRMELNPAPKAGIERTLDQA